ncbi:MAG: hypothetical protein JOZ87_08860 [Chloroflexi bacterium]|nr:hypothetical protein [Chloroflexota bacterium]
MAVGGGVGVEVSSGVEVGSRVEVGEGVEVGSRVQVGEGVEVGSRVEVGGGLALGVRGVALGRTAAVPVACAAAVTTAVGVADALDSVGLASVTMVAVGLGAMVGDGTTSAVCVAVAVGAGRLVGGPGVAEAAPGGDGAVVTSVPGAARALSGALTISSVASSRPISQNQAALNNWVSP